jgi:hypothetical protein
MIINIDFDATCVTHDYPNVGKDIGAIPVLKLLVTEGHKLILFTMRDKKELDDAVFWFLENEIPLYGIQTNPMQRSWTTSPKSYAQLTIDDSALGCPLINDMSFHQRPYVNWVEVKRLLEDRKILKKNEEKRTN